MVLKRFRALKKYHGELEHNVRLVYMFTLTFWAARSIIFQQVLSGYVFVLTESNKPVGIVKGIQGILQLVFTLPAGYVADHFRRDNVLRAAGLIGLVSAAVTFAAFDVGSIQLLYVAFGAWGIFNAFQSPAMEALFADSVPHGQRSRPFTVKYVLMNVALVLGPFISIFLFWHYGDRWQLRELRVVLLCGTAIGAAALFVLFYFNDDEAHEVKEDARQQRQAQQAQQEEEQYLLDYESQNESMEIPRAEIIDYQSLDQTVHSDDGIENKSFCGLTRRHVPTLLFVSDLIINNGAGMTINFFPLFFFQEYQLSPVDVNVLFVLQPFLIVLLSLLAQHLSSTCGRMPVIVSTRMASTCFLLWMSYAQPLWLQAVLFLLRGGTMRCSQALRRSVLMDHVPRKQRARWNSLEGLTVFSWSGSAVIGGYLIDAYGYRYCFKLTAIVYFAGLLVEMLLLPITHRSEAECPKPTTYQSSRERASES